MPDPFSGFAQGLDDAQSMRAQQIQNMLRMQQLQQLQAQQRAERLRGEIMLGMSPRGPQGQQLTGPNAQAGGLPPGMGGLPQQGQMPQPMMPGQPSQPMQQPGQRPPMPQPQMAAPGGMPQQGPMQGPQQQPVQPQMGGGSPIAQGSNSMFKGLDPTFSRNLQSLLQAANQKYGSQGLEFRPISGYRDFQKQADLYRRYLSGQGGMAAAPGTSFHNFGGAEDVWPYRNGQRLSNNEATPLLKDVGAMAPKFNVSYGGRFGDYDHFQAADHLSQWLSNRKGGAVPEFARGESGLPPSVQKSGPLGPVVAQQAQRQMLDWRTATQWVKDNRPGMRPEDVFNAVDGLRPFMSEDAQFQWKEIANQFKDQGLQLRQEGLDQRQRAEDERERANLEREKFQRDRERDLESARERRLDAGDTRAAETQRHNHATETLGGRRQDTNEERAAETARSHKANEELGAGRLEVMRQGLEQKREALKEATRRYEQSRNDKQAYQQMIEQRKAVEDAERELNHAVQNQAARGASPEVQNSEAARAAEAQRRLDELRKRGVQTTGPGATPRGAPSAPAPSLAPPAGSSITAPKTAGEPPKEIKDKLEAAKQALQDGTTTREDIIKWFKERGYDVSPWI